VPAGVEYALAHGLLGRTLGRGHQGNGDGSAEPGDGIGIASSPGTDPSPRDSSSSDPGDRHVLAAAIKAGAQVIVTSNLKHFPAADLRQWDVEAKSPDGFVLDQVGIDGRTVAACVQQIADSRTQP
jgi:hypothetical protein